MEPAPISAADRPRSGSLQGAGAAVIVDSEQHAALGWPCDDRHQPSGGRLPIFCVSQLFWLAGRAVLPKPGVSFNRKRRNVS